MSARLAPVGLLVARVALGVVFLMHGLQKFFFNGIDPTIKFFDSLEVPEPEVLARAAGAVELAGGIALILGVLLPFAGILLAIDLLGAFWYYHRTNGFWASDQGYEWVIALGLALLLVAFSGGGALALGRSGGRARARDTARPEGRVAGAEQ
jgi:putative oxidoreductase